MNSDERRKLENQLMLMGLAGLNSPELPNQMAVLISTEGDRFPGGKHAFYAGLLAQAVPQVRREMYEAIRPHLMFEPWPLDKYVEHIKSQSAEKESKSNPIEIGEQRYQEATQDEATGALAEFICYKCTAWNRYLGQTLVDAVTMARKDGWARDLSRQKEVCKKCAKKLIH